MSNLKDENVERITVRMSIKTHKMLRKLSYLTEKSMTQLMRDGANMIIEENRKILTNSDIVA